MTEYICEACVNAGYAQSHDVLITPEHVTQSGVPVYCASCYVQPYAEPESDAEFQTSTEQQEAK